MTTPNPVLRFARQHDIQSCSLSSLCLPMTFTLDKFDQFNAITKRLAPLRKRDRLFLQGMPFKSVFIIRSGSLKQVTTTDSDEEQITRFFLPSEMVGLDGLGEQRYPGSAIALETTTVCEVPFDRLDALSAQLPELRGYLYRSMSQEMHHERLMMRLLLRRTSDVRLASFFVGMSTRFRRRGYSPYCFRLAMSRSDIGNYLGLAVETVSRLLGRFQQLGLLVAQGREFRILDLDALIRLADGGGRRGG